MSTYPYDALAAKGVKMKDITSGPNNRAILHQIKNNNPSLTSLFVEEMYEEDGDDDVDVFYARDGDELGWLGYFIGENETLEYLQFPSLPAQGQVENFFIGLQRNKSIKHIEGVFGTGLSAMNLPHVTTMTMHSYPEGSDVEYLDFEEAGRFAVGLQQCKSLVTYNGPVTEDIVKSLTALPMLENVRFWRDIGPEISSDECTALSVLLSNGTELKQLDLANTGLGNEGLAILAEGFARNASLTDGALNLSDNEIGDEGLQALASSLASNTKLRELILANNNIGDVGLEALSNSLARNSALRVLSIAGNTSVTVPGMRSISRILQSVTSGLEHLYLDGIDVSDEGGNILADALSVNNSLVSLSLHSWWDDVSIGDDELRTLAIGLSHNSHLKNLDLAGNFAITPAGLCSLKEYVGSLSCALQALNLQGINIGDAGARALADALTGNKSLTNIFFDERSVTSNGWRSFLRLVCDASSPNSLYLSNQTLCHLGDYTRLSGSDGDVKDLVGHCLGINKGGYLAAKFKILCFFPDLDMVPLFQWNLKLLPVLKRWFEVFSTPYSLDEARIRNFELTTIYKFVRGLSVVVVDELKERERQEMQAVM